MSSHFVCFSSLIRLGRMLRALLCVIEEKTDGFQTNHSEHRGITPFKIWPSDSASRKTATGATNRPSLARLKTILSRKKVIPFRNRRQASNFFHWCRCPLGIASIHHHSREALRQKSSLLSPSESYVARLGPSPGCRQPAGQRIRPLYPNRHPSHTFPNAIQGNLTPLKGIFDAAERLGFQLVT